MDASFPPARVPALWERPLPPNVRLRLGTSWLHHDDYPFFVFWDAGENRFITASARGEVAVWPTAIAEPPRFIDGPLKHVTCCAFAPQSKLIFFGDCFANVCCVDLEMQTTRWTQEVDRSSIESLAVSAGERILLSNAFSGNMAIIDVQTGTVLRRPEPASPRTVSPGFTSEAKALLVELDCSVWELDAFTGNREQRWRAPRRLELEGCDLSRQTRIVAVAAVQSAEDRFDESGPRTLDLIDLTTWTLAVQGVVGQERIESLSFSASGDRIAVGRGRCVTTFRWSESELRPERELHSAEWVKATAFAFGGCALASGTSGRALNLWVADSNVETVGQFGHVGEVLSLVSVPSSDDVISGGFDNALFRWNSQTGRMAWKVSLDYHLAGRVVPGREGTLLVAANRAGKGHVIEVDMQGGQICESDWAGSAINSLCFDRRRGTVVTGHDEGEVQEWTRVGNLYQIRDGFQCSHNIHSVIYHAATGYTAWCDGWAELFVASNGPASARRVEFKGIGDIERISEIDGSEDLLILCSVQEEVARVNFLTAECRWRVPLKSGAGRCLCCLGPRQLWIGQANGGIVLIDPSTGELLWKCRPHSAAVQCLVPLSNASTLASASEDGQVYVLDLNAGVAPFLCATAAPRGSGNCGPALHHP